MKKWSPQWTQFMQLHKEAWKKKIQDFNGVWTRDLAIPVRCSTNWAMKPLTLGEGQLWVHMFPWKKWVLMIWNKSYMNPQLTCSQRQRLHSSVGRASHRHREYTGSNPVEVLNFSFFFFFRLLTQLHKLRSLRRSFLFQFISTVHIWFISYIIDKYFFINRFGIKLFNLR